ncbi:MAG: NAD-dependent epimerase/dehydratase family protein [Polyangiales bacterium]
MRVLVTGATGFIGGHLVPALEAAGHDLTLALRDPESASRLPTAGGARPHRTVVVGEIDERTDWTDAVNGAEAVVHLAARAHVLDDGATDEESFMRVNARGTARLADQSVRVGVRRFLLLSSIGAVTASSAAPVTIDTPCAPETPYGRSKLAAEQAVSERLAGTQTSYTILRPTLVYGPSNPGNMERLVKLVARGLPLPLGSIENRRSFTFVKNLVELITTALSHPHAENATFLVADGTDLSTPELIRRIAAVTGSATRVLPFPVGLLRALANGAGSLSGMTGRSLPLDAAALSRLESSLYVDIEPLRATLDWTPPYSVDDGLRCMLNPS